MSAEILLSKLHKVKRTGSGRWMACCSAHQDRNASLSIRELDDGRVLVHCFAECTVAEVLAAVGLEFSDLMPEQLQSEYKSARHAFSAWDVLKALAFEAEFIQMCALRLSKNVPLAAPDLDRLNVSANRIKSAIDAIGGAT